MPPAWIGATLLGALMPAAIASAPFWNLEALLAVFIVALGHALILGLPIALLYRAKRWQWPGLAVATGFLIGAIPIGVVIWPVEPRPGASTRINGVLVSVDGVPTLAGWLDFLRLLGVFGALGAAGALAFWLTLRWAGALDDPSSE
ncbi:hypothetical protein [Inquilinus limosus]|uniref:Uncharacterized protein n=1 Tax=Inquilinus limosus TaxID=171674 RepID=A0A211ZRJ0_9PROT|nr:hypothetical protein [Inquilinus limosus]OWJ67902.1 hypothetical protein BWR60_06740 [Inquilinus limosus]